MPSNEVGLDAMGADMDEVDGVLSPGEVPQQDRPASHGKRTRRSKFNSRRLNAFSVVLTLCVLSRILQAVLYVHWPDVRKGKFGLTESSFPRFIRGNTLVSLTLPKVHTSRLRLFWGTFCTF